MTDKVYQDDGNTANNVLIMGNQILNATPTGSYAGISAAGDGCSIINNYVKVTERRGIRTYGDNGRIVGNSIDGTDKDTGGSQGICAEQGDKVIISDNSIKNFNIGVILEYDDNIVKSNLVDASNSGVYFTSSGDTAHVMLRNMVSENNLHGCTTAIDKQNQGSETNILINNTGYNPVGNFTSPAIPSSTAPYTNSYGYPCQVQVKGGTVVDISIDGISTGLTSGFFILAPTMTITLNYTVAPTWTWWGL